MNGYTCEICGKPARTYPNVILSHGHSYHVGCMADMFEELRQAHRALVHRCNVQGSWGPWCDNWEGSFDQKHYGEEWVESDKPEQHE